MKPGLVFYAELCLRKHVLLVCLAGVFFLPVALAAQEQGPIAPPPEHTTVHRVDTHAPPPEAPPDLPVDQIIQRFSQKELEFAQAHRKYGFTKSLRLTEYGLDGKPSGEFGMSTQSVVASDGWVSQRVVDKPTSTLHYMDPEPPDMDFISKLPFYPLVPSEIPKYNIKYLGREKVDEIDCYIFEAKPKMVDRAHPYFQGIVWVDTKYIEIVKTYGTFVTDLGSLHSQNLPFSNFETYRENVEGKYWFPDYSRSDEEVHIKDHQVPVRLVIKWSDFKPLAVPPSTAASPSNGQTPPDKSSQP
jgi:hypothetical protein